MVAVAKNKILVRCSLKVKENMLQKLKLMLIQIGREIK